MNPSAALNDPNNPLLSGGPLPAFDAIRPEHVSPAIDALLAAADQALEAAVSDATPADFEALSRVLSVATERLGCAWGAVSHLKGVADTADLRAAYNENLPKVTEFYTRQGADERLYAKYKAIAAGPTAATLNAARQKALEHWLRDFVLSGAELQGEAKSRYAQIQDELARLSGATLTIRIIGRTDIVGGAAQNRRLSEGRAHSVLAAIHPEAHPSITFEAHGVTLPSEAQGARDATALSEDRRVSFQVTVHPAP